jgi:hypothetical protein
LVDGEDACGVGETVAKERGEVVGSKTEDSGGEASGGSGTLHEEVAGGGGTTINGET